MVDERSRLGDREADLVLGALGTGAIVTLAESKSHMYLTNKVFSKEAGEVSSAIAPPYGSHEQGLNEQGLNEKTNGLLRQFIPKGTDLRTVSDEDLHYY